VEEYTYAEKIVMAAAELPLTFSAEDLVVAVWKFDPAAFGLKHFTELYPDSNKILTYLMGRRGLVKAGLLNRVGEKMYQLAPAGRRAVSRLKGVLP